MKSILYVGATLMIGASIYGFVDYKQTHNKKEFKGMYEEKTAPETEITTDTKTTVPVVGKEEIVPVVNVTEEKKAVKNTSVVTKKKVAKKKRKFNTKLFSRGALDERYIEPKKIESVKTDTKKAEEKEQ